LNLGHDGVAVTSRNYKSRGNRPAVLPWLVAAALIAASAGPVLAQANPPPPATTPPAAAAASTPGAPDAAPATPAQSAASPSAGAVLPPPPQLEKRGFLNDFGQWWNKSIADFNAKVKENQSKLDEFNKQQNAAAKDAAAATQEAMKNAANAMVRLPTSKVVEIHEVCALAGNGAPDCQAAATNACKGKGFNTGQPVDIRTAEKCTASLWVSGQAPNGAECPVETVVLRATCQ
jgi:hypothetical protein